MDSTGEHTETGRRRPGPAGPVTGDEPAKPAATAPAGGIPAARSPGSRGPGRMPSIAGRGLAVFLPEVALPPKPIPVPRASDSEPEQADRGRPDQDRTDRGTEAIEADDPLTPFPGGEPTEEIPLWLPPDHHAPPAGRSVVAAAKARARTALGCATVVGTDKAATTPGPVADGDRDLPAPSAAQLLLDTSPGLSKFNIGTVPAPITPPPTWRRAGWFAGVSAGLVLASLVAVASAVQSNRIERRTALPDYPNVLLQTTTTAPRTTSGLTRPDGGRPGRPDGPRGSTISAAPPVGVTRSTLPGGVIVLTQPSTDGSGAGAATTKETATAGQPAGTVPATTSASPPSTETQLGLVLIRTTNTDALAPTTQQFFELASRDLRAAFDRFGSAYLKNRGFAAFAQDFGGVTRMQVTKIVVQPVLGSTVSTMTVTLADGTTTTQRRQLTFSSGDNPLVDDEHQL